MPGFQRTENGQDVASRRDPSPEGASVAHEERAVLRQHGAALVSRQHAGCCCRLSDVEVFTLGEARERAAQGRQTTIN